MADLRDHLKGKYPPEMLDFVGDAKVTSATEVDLEFVRDMILRERSVAKTMAWLYERGKLGADANTKSLGISLTVPLLVLWNMECEIAGEWYVRHGQLGRALRMAKNSVYLESVLMRAGWTEDMIFVAVNLSDERDFLLDAKIAFHGRMKSRAGSLGGLNGY